MQKARSAIDYQKCYHAQQDTARYAEENTESALGEVLLQFTAAEEELIKLISKGHHCSSLAEMLGRDPKAILTLLSSIIEKRNAKALE